MKTVEQLVSRKEQILAIDKRLLDDKKYKENEKQVAFLTE